MSGVLGLAGRIGRVELRRSFRTVLGETNKLVGIGLSVLIIGAFTLGGAAAIVFFGEKLPEVLPDVQSAVRGGIASMWLVSIVMVTFRTISVTGEIDHAPGMLTTVSPRTVVLGLLFAEAARFALYLAIPVVVLAGALAIGTGNPLAGLALVGIAIAVAMTALPTGYAVGQTIRYLSRSVPVVRANRMKLGVVGMVIYIAAFFQFGKLTTALSSTPVGWLADPLLLAVAGVGSPGHAVAVFAGAFAGAPVFGHVAYKLALWNWYADPAEPEPGDDEASTGAFVDELTAALQNVVSKPTAAVVRTTWLRARRMPFKLTFAFVPVFMFVGYLVPELREGSIPEFLPVMVGLYGALSIGAAFTLNPLGDEGALLPITIGSGIGGRRFVRGRILAGWLLGVAPLAVLALAFGLVAGTDPLLLGLAVVYAIALTLAAPAVAIGLGMAFPNFDAQTVMMNREAVVPSIFAFFGYMLTLVVVAAPGGFAFFFAHSPTELPAALPVVQGVGVLASAALGLVIGGPSYIYAVRKFEGYEPGE